MAATFIICLRPSGLVLLEDLSLFAISPQSRGSPLIRPSEKAPWSTSCSPRPFPFGFVFPEGLAGKCWCTVCFQLVHRGHIRQETPPMGPSLFSNNSPEASACSPDKIEQALSPVFIFFFWFCYVLSGDISLYRGLPFQCCHLSPNGTDKHTECECFLKYIEMYATDFVSMINLHFYHFMFSECNSQGGAAQFGVWRSSGCPGYDDSTNGTSPGVWTLGR